MNEQAHMVNQNQSVNQTHIIMNQQQQQMMNQNQNQVSGVSVLPQFRNPNLNQPPPQLMNQNPSSQMLMNQAPPPPPPSMIMNRSYGLWPPPLTLQQQQQHAVNAKLVMDQQQQQQQPPIKLYQTSFNASFSAPQSSSSSARNNNNWKGKRGVNAGINRIDGRKNEQQKPLASSGMMKNVGPPGGYKPPTLHELQSQNRKSARKFYQRKKFSSTNTNRFAPYAPRNTTSFLIRAKKSGGIASLVSPCPVTPAVLPTPMFSPSREVLGDMAKEEWGVDGYGSMKGLIRLRSPGYEAEMHDDDEGSSESDVEEHVEVERRLDHDLSRFEMIYPNCEVEYNNLLENRVDDQDTHIAQLEEENLTLKERLFLMERELGDLRRRLHCLERQTHMDDVQEAVVENGSDNESDSSRNQDFRARNDDAVDNTVADNEGSCADAGFGENTEDGVEYISGVEQKVVDSKDENNNETVDLSMDSLAIAPKKDMIEDEDKSKDGEKVKAFS